MKYRYNVDKNKWLKAERNISFDVLLEDGKIITEIVNRNPLRQNQMELVVIWNNYCYSIPFIYEDDGTRFLKTAHKDRDLNEIYNKNRS